MNAGEMDIVVSENWRPKVLIIGAVVGAAIGLAGAYLLAQNSKEGKPPEISSGEGVKLGLLVLGLLRSVATLNEGG